MSKFIKIWAAPQPRTYKRVLFRYCDGRRWRYRQNWKFNKSWPHFNIITPVFRLTKCNGKIEFGFGNHYFEFGW